MCLCTYVYITFDYLQIYHRFRCHVYIQNVMYTYTCRSNIMYTSNFMYICIRTDSNVLYTCVYRTFDHLQIYHRLSSCARATHAHTCTATLGVGVYQRGWMLSIYIWISKCTCGYPNIYICTSIYIHMYVYVYIHTCTYIYIPARTLTYTYTYIRVCVRVYVYVCVYVFVYVHRGGRALTMHSIAETSKVQNALNILTVDIKANFEILPGYSFTIRFRTVAAKCRKCVSVCGCVCMCICMWMHASLATIAMWWGILYKCIYIHIYIYKYICIYKYIYTCIYTYIYRYTCKWIYI